MKKKSNPLYGEISESGKCCLLAIGYMFNLDAAGILYVAKRMGFRDGMTTKQCRQCIELLSFVQKKRFVYTPNWRKLTARQYQEEYRKGKFIVNQEGHLSCVVNGTFIDDYSPSNYKILGWWEIVPKGATTRKERDAEQSKQRKLELQELIQPS